MKKRAARQRVKNLDEGEARRSVDEDLGATFGRDRVRARRIALTAADGVPFWREALTGKETWELTITDLSPASGNAMAGRLLYVRSLLVTLNPLTGRVLKITSPWPADVPPVAPFPSVEEEERQLVRAYERFTTLPDARPAVSFFRALKTIEVFGPISAQDTKQIIAYYVELASVRHQDVPAWIVQTRGLPPFDANHAELGPPIPVDYRNHVRHIVDARTAEWLWSDTIPQPALDAH